MNRRPGPRNSSDKQSKSSPWWFRLRATTSYAGVAGEIFIRRFIGAVRGREAPPATLADAWRTARIIETAETSARTGRFVRLRQAGIQAEDRSHGVITTEHAEYTEAEPAFRVFLYSVVNRFRILQCSMTNGLPEP